MTFSEWKKKSKRMAYTLSLLPKAEAVLSSLASSAYKAGMLHGENKMRRCVMGRSAEAYQEQQEQENLSGINEYEEWCSLNEGKFLCPYCGDVSNELKLCCGEVHGREVVYKSAKEMCENNHKILNQFSNLITLEK